MRARTPVPRLEQTELVNLKKYSLSIWHLTLQNYVMYFHLCDLSSSVSEHIHPRDPSFIPYYNCRWRQKRQNWPKIYINSWNPWRESLNCFPPTSVYPPMMTLPESVVAVQDWSMTQSDSWHHILLRVDHSQGSVQEPHRLQLGLVF